MYFSNKFLYFFSYTPRNGVAESLVVPFLVLWKPFLTSSPLVFCVLFDDTHFDTKNLEDKITMAFIPFLEFILDFEVSIWIPISPIELSFCEFSL